MLFFVSINAKPPSGPTPPAASAATRATMNSLRLGIASRVVSGARQCSSLRTLAAASSSAVSPPRKRDESSCLLQQMGPRRPSSSSTTVSNVGLPIPLPFKERK